jgi:hypothetical protein
MKYNITMQITEKHKAGMRPDFSTHLNYIRCIEESLKDAKLKVNVKNRNKIPVEKTKRFLQLSGATDKSLRAEIEMCMKTSEYTQVVAAWFPVKCYYRIYYLEAVMLYLLNGNIAVFSKAGHSVVRKNIKTAIKTKEIDLSGNNELGQIVCWEEADSFKSKKSATTRYNYYLDDDCSFSIRGKIAEYLEQKWFEDSPFENKRGNTVKIHKQKHLYSQEICLLDYFYQMRLKFNYRDSNFLDRDNVFDSDLLDFMLSFYRATTHYSNLLNTNIDLLLKSRGMNI